MQWVVAIDGGGSKIAIALQSLDGSEPHRLENSQALSAADYRCLQFAGTGSAHPQTWSQSQANLRVAIEEMQASLPKGDSIRTILFALAGAGRPADQKRVVDWARGLPSLANSDAVVRCVGDIDPLVAHQVRSAGGTIAVILGTGSIVAARNTQGELVRGGGWGPQLGDECSGAALGLVALRAVCQWIDQGAPPSPTPLVQKVLGEIQGSDAAAPASSCGETMDISRMSAELIRLAADRGSAAKFSLALVQSALEAGDPQARGLLQPHLQAIAQQVASVCQRAWPDKSQVNLVFAGGLVARQPELQTAVTQACAELGVPVHESVLVDPLVATLQMALRLGNFT